MRLRCQSYLPNIPAPQQIGSLLPEVIAKRTISGNALKYHGVEAIDLPRCFEKAIPPPTASCAGSSSIPSVSIWPEYGKTRFSDRVQTKREDLLGWHGTERQKAAQREALFALEQKGAEAFPSKVVVV